MNETVNGQRYYDKVQILEWNAIGLDYVNFNNLLRTPLLFLDIQRTLYEYKIRL